MGSQSDWPIMKHASDTLENLAINHEKKVVSAHRTPDLLFEYAESASVRGIEVIIAGAGGAAHLPGMTAAKTHIPVIGVPIKTKSLEGKDSLLSILQMPAGICRIDNNESLPSRLLVFIGTPITGMCVFAAVIPGRCAAPPAPAIITSIPRTLALSAYSNNKSGVLCADTTFFS